MEKKEQQKNKYFVIEPVKERSNIFRLADIIMEDGWIDNSVTLVNCSPDYSSITTQILNHKLSFINKNELFPVLNLEMPYPNMSQVWDPVTDRYELYDTYLDKWIKKNVYSSSRLLFIESGVLRGKNFNKLKLCLQGKIERENYKLASVYLQSSAIIKPDYYVQQFDFEKDGGLVFWWENLNNPNWNY